MSPAEPHDVASEPSPDQHPVVDLPRPGLPGAAIAGIAALLALLLFIVLDGRRRAAVGGGGRAAAVQVDAFTPPPPLTVPAEPTPVLPPPQPPAAVPITPAPQAAPLVYGPPTPPATVIVPVPSAPLIPAERPPARDDTAALVIDGGGEASRTSATTSPSGERSETPNQASTGTSSDDTPARATAIGNRSTLMATGTLIPAVLETPIDTSRPGLIRAVVSRDTRGFDGARVLVPRGSRLIGEYQGDIRSGQNRVLVTWVRLLRPDGVSIRIGSPAADPLGGAGVPGRVNNFFLQRFAAAVLQSALTVGVNLASRPGDGSVIVGLPASQIGSAVGQGLIPDDFRPKVTVKQGAALNVFVARDLDFSGAPSEP